MHGLGHKLIGSFGFCAGGGRNIIALFCFCELCLYLQGTKPNLVMKEDLTAMTAAELVAQWAESTKILCQLETVSANQIWEFGRGDKRFHEENIAGWKETNAAITAELDARCERNGISIEDNSALGRTFLYSVLGTRSRDGKMWVGLPATEQHALEGYLLAKGGSK